MESLDLFSQQDRNRRRSRWVVAAFILFFAWLGFGGDFIAWQMTAGADAGSYHHVVPWFGVLLTAAGGAIALFAWKNGPGRVLWSASAREVVTPANDLERQLVNVVEEMAIASGLPRPRIWIIPDLDPNAFATGHDEHDAHVAVTEGLLLALDRDELQGVIAHELGHIRNLDVRLMTLLAALVGAVLLVSDGMGRMMRFGRLPGGRGGGGGRGRGKNGNPLIVVLLLLWLISWLLAPLIIRMLSMAVSRNREYLADAMSAQFTRNPLALASALEKIEHAPEATASIKKGSAHLCIADPLGRRSNLHEGRLAGWFGSHPPMVMRVARLRAMGYQALKREPTTSTAIEA